MARLHGLTAGQTCSCDGWTKQLQSVYTLHLSVEPTILILQFAMLIVRSSRKQEKCMFTWLYEPIDPTVRQPSNRVKSFGVLVTWNLTEGVRSIAISVSVCLFVCSHISKTTRPIFMQLSHFCGLGFLRL